MGDDVVLFVDDLKAASATSFCRICHEEEFESCKSLEAPCACSGTAKYAHRDCIQRWCDEKGNTTCEICLQKFEAGYTAAPKMSQLPHAAVTIRGSLEVPRRGPQIRHPTTTVTVVEEPLLQTNYPECSLAADRTTGFCRSVALVFAVVLLMGHLLDVLSGREEDCPFSLATLLIVKVSGIVIPMYIIIRIITAIQDSIRDPYQESDDDDDYASNWDEEDDDEQHQHYRVDVPLI